MIGHYRWLNTMEHGLWISKPNAPTPKELNVYIDSAMGLRLVLLSHSARGLNQDLSRDSPGWVDFIEVQFNAFDTGEEEDEPSEWNILDSYLKVNEDCRKIFCFETKDGVIYELILDKAFLLKDKE